MAGSNVEREAGAFTVARVCRDPDTSEAELRLSRFALSGAPLLAETGVARAALAVERPGLALQGERTVVAFAGSIYEFGADASLVAGPVALSEARDDVDAESTGFEAELAFAGERLFASGCSFDAYSLVWSRPARTLRAFDASLGASSPVRPRIDFPVATPSVQPCE